MTRFFAFKLPVFFSWSPIYAKAQEAVLLMETAIDKLIGVSNAFDESVVGAATRCDEAHSAPSKSRY